MILIHSWAPRSNYWGGDKAVIFISALFHEMLFASHYSFGSNGPAILPVGQGRVGESGQNPIWTDGMAILEHRLKVSINFKVNYRAWENVAQSIYYEGWRSKDQHGQIDITLLRD